MKPLQQERENFNRLRRAHDHDPIGPAVHLAIPDLADPWFLHVAEEICRATDTLGHGLRLSVTRGDHAREAEAAAVCEVSDGIGLIVVTTAAVSHRLGPASHVVAIGPEAGGAAVTDVPTVVADRGKAIETAIDHLAALGHRNIGFVYGGLPYARQDTLRLARHAAEKRGIGAGLRTFVEESDGGSDDPQLDVGRPGDVTAFLVSDDARAALLVRELRNAGVHVPIDVSVSGYSHCGVGAPAEGLTTVDQHITELAHTVVDAIVRGRPPLRRSFAPQLKVGATTGYAARPCGAR